MLTYQGKPEIKEMFQARFAAHRQMDEVIQGTGFDGKRGCFIGCTMNAYSHEAFSNRIGPLWLAKLADKIFEGLPENEAPQFGTDLLEAIPVGVDIDFVQWKLAIVRHERQITRLKGNNEPYAEECRQALRQVIDFCKNKLDGTSTRSAWSARSAARSAVESAEWSAAKSAARSAAAWSARSAVKSAWSAEWSVAESAAKSAELAALAVESAWSAAKSAARSSEFQIERDALLSILRNIK